MSLRPIVQALGGDLYDRGQRANIPAPGHSAADRSVSLLLKEGRIIVHTFGDGDWRAVLDQLRAEGLVDAHNAPNGADRLSWEVGFWSEIGASRSLKPKQNQRDRKCDNSPRSREYRPSGELWL